LAECEHLTAKERKERKGDFMAWVAVKRKYHGADEIHRPWIVMRAGALRGVCECWEEADAEMIAAALNRARGNGHEKHEEAQESRGVE
jgi:hypothetical protein